jgi:CubicO group peptidase (beta-lactamase class C family)
MIIPLLVLAGGVWGCARAQTAVGKRNVKAGGDEVGARIARVERNLFRWVRIQGEPGWKLEDRMKYYKVNGVSIAVIHNYRIEWARGYGLADTAEGRAVTVKTVFQAASISKSLNAMGLLKLAEQRRVALDTDINTYLVRWKFPYDSLSRGEKISIAHLLSHTAGLSVHGFNGYKRGDSLPDLPAVLDGRKPANSPAVRSEFEPGLIAQYSGGGIVISQLIVEDVTHQPYGSFMSSAVLQPLGMTSSCYALEPDSVGKGERGASAREVATAYRHDGRDIGCKYHVYPELAAAGLWTTPSDIARFVVEMQLAVAGRSEKVLTHAMARKMLTPYLNKTSALGCFIVRKGDAEYFFHTGANEGFSSEFIGSVEGGNGLVIMLNSDNAAIMDEIANSVATVYDWKNFVPRVVRKPVRVADSVLGRYIGKYALDDSAGYITIGWDSPDRGRLVLEDSRVKEKWRIYFTAPTEFILREVPWGVQQFDADKQGCLFLNMGAGRERACKVE